MGAVVGRLVDRHGAVIGAISDDGTRSGYPSWRSPDQLSQRGTAKE
jgi:hypothetical protein